MSNSYALYDGIDPQHSEETTGACEMSPETLNLMLHQAQMLGIGKMPYIECADGLVLSVKAGSTVYCDPLSNTGPYHSVEVGFPSQPVPELMQWAENPDNPTDTVYAYVPIEVVCAVINAHGGPAK